MSPIPEPTITIASLIDAHHEAKREGSRTHLGCSQLGHPCDRWLWLYFRWAIESKFQGRILRLFRRGQLEEKTVIEDLQSIGLDVDSSQSWVNFGSHVSGSVDGVVSNVPTKGKKRAVLEIKTHSAKSFRDLERHGLQKSKPEHYVQMQTYMLGLGLDRGLYFAINKDDDSIFTEWVHFDKEVATKAVERGKRIALSDRMPEPISVDPEWYQCRLCNASSFCHSTKLTNQVNCRTCAHSTAKPNSTWRCELHNADDIPKDFQRTGCSSHVLHPDLVPWKVNPEHATESVACFEIDGILVHNGEPDENVYSSRELLDKLQEGGLVSLARLAFNA